MSLRVTPAGDRLYVRARDGRIVAWYDREDGGEGARGAVEAGRIRLVHTSLRAEVLAVLAPYVTGDVTVGPPPVPTSAELTRLALHPDDDLAPNRPGEALHAALDHLPPPGRLASLGRDPHRAARARLAAEERVGAALDRLGAEGWRTLHSLPLPGGDRIDHLAVGPGGVLAVHDVPARRLRVVVANGELRTRFRLDEEIPPLRLAYRLAERAAHALATTVRPVLVVVDATRLEIIPPRPRDIRIVRDADVPALGALGGVHKPADVDALFATARARQTWQRA
ncbi:nuclease-related domain-containing protein [Streptomyces sp. NPDC020875]|uniref:nuclease-related domain-containing protein n=1 Tax=Streptomyces sp. NPDC020875 TaxID=3154898 RepID=UPI0033DDE876